MENPAAPQAPSIEARELDDFDIARAPAPLSALLGLPDAVVSVRRRSTGIERLYPEDSEWGDSMFTDWAEGRFGD